VTDYYNISAMNSWSSEHYGLQRRRRRDYSPNPLSRGYDYPGIRRHSERQHYLHERDDAHPLDNRSRTLDDVTDRTRRIPDFSSKQPRPRLSDAVTGIGSFVEKSFGKSNAHTKLRTDAQQRPMNDSDELFYADSRYRRDR